MGIFLLWQPQLTFVNFGPISSEVLPVILTLTFCLIEIVLPDFKTWSFWVLNSCNKLDSMLFFAISLLAERLSLRLACSAASNFKACSKADFKSKTSIIRTTVCTSGSFIQFTKYWSERISHIFAGQSRNAKFLSYSISEANSCTWVTPDFWWQIFIWILV